MMVAARRAFRGYYSNAEFGDDVPFVRAPFVRAWRPLEIRAFKRFVLRSGCAQSFPACIVFSVNGARGRLWNGEPDQKEFPQCSDDARLSHETIVTRTSDWRDCFWHRRTYRIERPSSRSRKALSRLYLGLFHFSEMHGPLTRVFPKNDERERLFSKELFLTTWGGKQRTGFWAFSVYVNRRTTRLEF